MGRPKKVLIVGGGFGGIAAAREFERHNNSNIEVTLVSNTSHFEYHAALYRVVTGRSPLEVCIPLSEIINPSKTVVVKDTIEKIQLTKQVAIGSNGSEYLFDYLIFAVGCKTTYFSIPGLKEHSFTLRTIDDALRLKRHIHQIYNETAASKQKKPIDIVVAGGGATGVELSGELAVYTKKLARQHGVPPSLVTITLFEASSRLLPTLHLTSSIIAEKRLRALGVNIFVNAPIQKKDIENVYLEQMKIRTKTVIWTAGTTSNEVAKKSGFTLNHYGKIEVRQTLQSRDNDSVFVVGDAASTEYSGMAQTAIHDGEFAARQIINLIFNRELATYRAKLPYYSIPVGPGWALLEAEDGTLTGKLGWIFRRFVDFKFFQSILPAAIALRAFQEGRKIYETCPECSSIDAKEY